METDDIEKLLIESKFERLVSKSKNYINSRSESDLIALRNDLIHLKLKLESKVEKTKSIRTRITSRCSASCCPLSRSSTTQSSSWRI